jgi:HAD hydrolase, TIGR02254 family
MAILVFGILKGIWEIMAKYKYLLWDIDGTILNFEVAERAAIRSLFDKFNLGTCSDEMLMCYSQINKRYWQLMESGKIKKDKMLVERFIEFFSNKGINADIAAEFNKEYQIALCDTIVFNDDAIDIIKHQKKICKIIIVTNGTKVVQEKKLESSGLNDIVDNVFISELVGFEKPNVKFFEKVISVVGIKDLKEALIIGDSLTSDIQGGHNIGIDTCWYNPKNEENETLLKPTYIIKNLHELENII